MKNMKKLIALMLMLSLVLSLGVTAAFAEPADPTGADESQYEWDQNSLAKVVGTTMTFDKYLVLYKGADVPDVKFKFVITPGEGGDNKGEEVFVLPTPAPSPRPADYDAYRTAGADSSAYTVIGQPEFKTGTDTTLDTTNYSNDTAILTFKKGDTKKDEAPVATTKKTIDFITDASATGAPAWYASDEEYVEKPLTLDFSKVTFLEPGVYRYTIKEIQEYSETKAQSGLDPLPGLVFDPGPGTRGGVSKERYLDVYVVDEDGKLVIKGYILHEKVAAPGIDADNKGTKETAYKAADAANKLTDGANELLDKSTGFTNQYPTKSLAFKKVVQGNQASRDKFFKFTVTITPPDNVTIDEKHWFELDMTEDEWVWSPAENVATEYKQDAMDEANNPQRANTTDFKIENGRVYVSGKALTEGKDFYLQHGNSVMIRNLPAGATYAVVEVEEDYAKLGEKLDNYKNVDTGVLKEVDEAMNRDGSAVTEAPDKGEVATSFINKRDGVIPTGILSMVAPAVAVILLGVGGLSFILVGKRRREEEEA